MHGQRNELQAKADGRAEGTKGFKMQAQHEDGAPRPSLTSQRSSITTPSPPLFFFLGAVLANSCSMRMTKDLESRYLSKWKTRNETGGCGTSYAFHSKINK